MLKLHDLDIDQAEAADVIFEQDHNLLIGLMGSGKTVVALTAIEELFHAGALTRVLVIAPLRVADSVWRGEHAQWEYLKHLRVGIATGVDKVAVINHVEDYDVIVINFDILPWAADNDVFKHFDGLIIDEGTKLKAHGAWFKSLRRHIKDFKWRTVMTGTPVSENFQQLFYQMFIVDGGATFGRNRDKFMKKFFNQTDYKGYKFELKPDAAETIAKLIKPYVHVIPDYRDNLPPLTIEHVNVPLPPWARRTYREMAGAMISQGVTAKNAAQKIMKLQQIASGFLYTSDGKSVLHIHNAKMNALEIVLQKISENGRRNIIIIYTFTEELDRLMDLYPHLCELEDSKTIDDWNAGKIRLLAFHVKSGGHGINLAAGGSNIILLGPQWSRDATDQVIGRLWRRGQTKPVTAHIITAIDTVDNQVIIPRLAGKADNMPLLLEHLAKQAE